MQASLKPLAASNDLISILESIKILESACVVCVCVCVLCLSSTGMDMLKFSSVVKRSIPSSPPLLLLSYFVTYGSILVVGSLLSPLDLCKHAKIKIKHMELESRFLKSSEIKTQTFERFCRVILLGSAIHSYCTPFNALVLKFPHLEHHVPRLHYYLKRGLLSSPFSFHFFHFWTSLISGIPTTYRTYSYILQAKVCVIQLQQD